jgi:hypothetical protein
VSDRGRITVFDSATFFPAKHEVKSSIILNSADIRVNVFIGRY